MKLGNKSKQLFRFIERYWQLNRIGPIYQEMCDECGLKSKSNIKPYLEKLKSAGFIEYTEGKPRTIRPVTASSPMIRVPMMGSISAGEPIPPLDSDNPDLEYYSLALNQLPNGIDPKTLYILRVNGDSLSDANVQNGDLVVIAAQFTMREGDTLVFWIKDEQATTLKKYYQDGDTVLLQPANLKYKTRPKHRELVEAQGKVVQLIRNFQA